MAITVSALPKLSNESYGKGTAFSRAVENCGDLALAAAVPSLDHTTLQAKTSGAKARILSKPFRHG